MDSENILFSSQSKLKEVKNLYLEFESVLNQIKVVQNYPNNLCFKKISVSNETIELGDKSSGNGSGYLNEPSDFDVKKVSKHNPVYNFSAACRTYESSCPNVLRNWDMADVSKNNSVYNFGAASKDSDGSYSNVQRDENIEKTFAAEEVKSVATSQSDSNKIFDFALKGNSGNGDLKKPMDGCLKAKVYGCEVPKDYGFNEERLKMVLNEESSSKTLVNYFCYLFDDYGGEDVDVDIKESTSLVTLQSHDTLEYSDDMDVEIGQSTSLLALQNHGSDEKFQFKANVDGDVALASGLTDEPTMIDVVYDDITTESISTSPNVDVTNLFAETHFMPPRECSDNNAFDYGSVGVNCGDAINECETIEFKRHRLCDNSGMFVPTSDSGPKKYCCKYCNVRTQKLERHLRTVHKDEANVKEYLAFPPHSAQRRKIIEQIHKDGDFKWNNKPELNHGECAVRRRPNKKFQKNPWDLILCPGCSGYFGKSYLRRHWKKECSKNLVKDERGLLQLARAVEGRLSSDASEDLVNVFARFRENENIRYIRFDWLVVCYGNDLCLNHSLHYQESYICGKLRAAGRVLRESKSISTDITDMSSIFRVKYCNTIVDAIRKIAKFDHKTKRFGSPGTASTTVTLINAIGNLLVIEAMRLEDTVKERHAKRFLEVFQTDARNKINKLVAITRVENRRHKNDNIPTTADVSKLAKYLDSERNECFSRLVQEYSYPTWLRLSQTTMASILIYNRRRAGEMQNLLIEDFEKRDIVADQCDMLIDSMPEEARRNIKSRLMVRNKLGKKSVPMLLKHSWDDCLELLVHHRSDAGIPESNKYLFSLPTQMDRIRTNNVCTIMRSFSVACGAKNPSSLRGTNLRKHLASFCSTKDLSDNDISNLAEFMGHAEPVHRAFYRTNPLANQVSKMSFLFDSAQGNDSSGDSSDDNSDCSEDEYESDNESAALTPLQVNPTRKTANKNVKSGTNKKRKSITKKKDKRNASPKATTQKRKETATATKVKQKRNAMRKETNRKRKTSVNTTEMKKK